jgi:Mu-like prophage major head subunit gpT
MPGPSIFTTNTNFQSQSKVLKAVYSKENKEAPPLYPMLFNDYDNEAARSFMTFLPVTNMGTFSQKNEGAPPAFDNLSESIASTFNFQTYALAYKLTEEANLEDPHGLAKKLPKFLSKSERVSKDLLIWNILNLGFAGGPLLADGVVLFSASHPIARGGTYSNLLANTALTPESLQAAYILMETLSDDATLPSFRTPRYLVVRPELHKIAQEILGSEYYPYSDENRRNVVEGTVQVIVSRYQTSTTQWGVFAGKGDLDGDTHSLFYSFKWQNKQTVWEDGETGNINHRSSFRLGFGSVDGRGSVGSQGA